MTTMLRSIDPASEELVWEGAAHDAVACDEAVKRARSAFSDWAATSLDERIAIARRFAEALKADSDGLSNLNSRETGKLLWETRTEVTAMIGKAELSIAAQAERAGTKDQAMPFGRAVLRRRPHGVMVVLGPYNFPGHLPNGHIVPALLAGNTVVFKPSEEAPATAERMARAWTTAGLPEGVFQVVQGGRETGAALLDANIDGLLFTGSATAGVHFRRQFADRPGVILALELGGNNPLIAWDGDAAAIASLVAHSAFITTGQRCSCSRRLILPEGSAGDRMLDAIIEVARKLPIASWVDPQEDELLAAKAHIEKEGIEVLGPTYHGIFKSIYFFDPNGHRLELACNIGTPEQNVELRSLAPEMLEEWSRTKRVPRHAAWLHEEPKS